MAPDECRASFESTICDIGAAAAHVAEGLIAISKGKPACG